MSSTYVNKIKDGKKGDDFKVSVSIEVTNMGISRKEYIEEKVKQYPT